MARKYLEDFKAGEIYKHWPGRTIRDYDNTWFTLLTMNTNPLHFDEHYAGQTDHGKCLVVGTLVFGIVVGMSVKDMSESCIANLEYEFVKHLGPTFAGDTLYAESEVLEVAPSQSRTDRGILYIETRASNQRKEQIMTLRRRILMPRRAESA